MMKTSNPNMNLLKFMNLTSLVLAYSLLAIILIGFEYGRFKDGNISLEVHIAPEFSKGKTVIVHGQQVVVGEIGSVNYQADSFLQILIYKDINLILNCLSVIIILIYAYHFILKEGDRLRDIQFLRNRLSGGGVFLCLLLIFGKFYAIRWVEHCFYSNNLGALELNLHNSPYSSLILLIPVSVGISCLISNYTTAKK